MSSTSEDIEGKVQDLYTRVGALAVAFGGLMTALESEGSPLPVKVTAFLHQWRDAAAADGLVGLAQRIEDMIPKR